MDGSALDIKDYVEQKDLINRYGRQDIIFVMLDGFKNVRGEIGKNQNFANW